MTPVLDHGFVRVIDKMGNDAAVVQAARVSYGAGTKTVSKDRALIRHLMRNRHTSPFEMCEIKLHIKLPIFVMRQLIRHRTANVNEYSGRYSLMINEFYVPDLERIQGQGVANKQGSEGALPEAVQRSFVDDLVDNNSFVTEVYNVMIEAGVARETARLAWPLNGYTECYWKIDLHNFMHLCQLRADGHAQEEIREYAKVFLAILEEWCPITYEAFIDYRMEAVTFSKQQMQVLKSLLCDGQHCMGEDVPEMSKQEQEALKRLLNVHV